jgi:SET domain-containing protein
MLLVKTRIDLSEIHGIGLFADEFIPKGTVTWRFLEGFDLRLPESILAILSGPSREQFLKYTYVDFASGLYELCADDARFFNHSDEPNTASVQPSPGDEVDVATRDISQGEELTCDYRTFDRDWKKKLGRS